MNMLKKGTKIRVNDDAFVGLTQFNGTYATAEDCIGQSEETQRFQVANGSIFLSADQFVIADKLPG